MRETVNAFFAAGCRLLKSLFFYSGNFTRHRGRPAYESRPAMLIFKSSKIQEEIVSSKSYWFDFSSFSKSNTVTVFFIGFTIQYSLTPAVRYLKSLMP